MGAGRERARIDGARRSGGRLRSRRYRRGDLRTGPGGRGPRHPSPGGGLHRTRPLLDRCPVRGCLSLLLRGVGRQPAALRQPGRRRTGDGAVGPRRQDHEASGARPPRRTSALRRRLLLLPAGGERGRARRRCRAGGGAGRSPRLPQGRTRGEDRPGNRLRGARGDRRPAPPPRRQRGMGSADRHPHDSEAGTIRARVHRAAYSQRQHRRPRPGQVFGGGRDRGGPERLHPK